MVLKIKTPAESCSREASITILQRGCHWERRGHSPEPSPQGLQSPGARHNSRCPHRAAFATRRAHDVMCVDSVSLHTEPAWRGSPSSFSVYREDRKTQSMQKSPLAGHMAPPSAKRRDLWGQTEGRGHQGLCPARAQADGRGRGVLPSHPCFSDQKTSWLWSQRKECA